MYLSAIWGLLTHGKAWLGLWMGSSFYQRLRDYGVAHFAPVEAKTRDWVECTGKEDRAPLHLLLQPGQEVTKSTLWEELPVLYFNFKERVFHLIFIFQSLWIFYRWDKISLDTFPFEVWYVLLCCVFEVALTFCDLFWNNRGCI